MVNSGEFLKIEFFKIFAKMSRRVGLLHLSAGDLRALFTVVLGFQFNHMVLQGEAHLCTLKCPASHMPSTWSPPRVYRTGGTAASPFTLRSVVCKHGIKSEEEGRSEEFEEGRNSIGTVRRFEVVRNRKAEKSKHFEFIEFQSPKVAKVGEECMHNYLIPEASKMLASPPSTCMQRDFGQSREAQRRRPTLLFETAKINGVSDCQKIQKGREIARRKEINSHKQQAFTIISESELATLLPPMPAARFQLTGKLPSLVTVKFKHKNKVRGGKTTI
ncbi:hypothetical protein C2S52_006234 [Perilla frutescens var. hirtella]|nr:hypothetical protein C2S52_006234 [Perilla frutescens var. hirtella]